MFRYHQSKYVKGETMNEKVQVHEIERIKDLVKVFGWEMTKQEIVGDKQVLTLEKATEPIEVELSAGSS